MRNGGLAAADGIISSTYGKDPDDPDFANDKDILEWKAFMRKWYPNGSLESASNVYAVDVARTLIHVLEKAGDNLTRENIMKQAADIKDLVLPLRLPGIKLNTSATDFAPIEEMQLMRFDGKNGTWNRFGKIIGAK